MPSLKNLIEHKRQSEKLSIEKMSRTVDISRTQFTTVMNSGFTDGTSLKTVRGFARLLGLKDWQLLKVLSGQD